jgi:type I restriction enzyme S subunit
MINLEVVKSTLLPLPSVDRQEEIVRTTHTQQQRVHAAVEALTEQVDVLAERRRALITAAVTGELEIPGVAA